MMETYMERLLQHYEIDDADVSDMYATVTLGKDDSPEPLIRAVCCLYDLNAENLRAILAPPSPLEINEEKDIPVTEPTTLDSVTPPPQEVDEAVLQKHTVAQLKVMCKAAALPVSGAKQLLINRLLNRSPPVSALPPSTEAVSTEAVTTQAPVSTDDEASLGKSTLPVLKTMCKERHLKVSGTKAELIARLLGKPAPEKVPRVAKPKTVKKSKKTVPPVLQRFDVNKPTLQLSRNDFGNYEHRDTTFCFNPSTEVVIGKQLPTGKVAPLTLDDINRCIELKFPYELPPNLD
jgi:hypothetical protein